MKLTKQFLLNEQESNEKQITSEIYGDIISGYMFVEENVQKDIYI